MARPLAGRSGTDDDFKARARAWAEGGCVDQGLPVKVSDPEAIRKVCELLGQARQTGVRRASSKRL